MSAQAPLDDAHEPADARAEWLFPAVVWLAMSVMAVAYVWLYGRPVPYMEDWELVPTLSGATPLRLGWLWEQTVEHHYVLARAILYPLWNATRDPRSAMYINALLLSALALALILTARRLRGRVSFADAFFPLAVLHWAHGETIIFFYSLSFVLPVVQAAAVVMIIATDLWKSRRWALWVLALCVALQPLNGGIGLLLAPPLAVWMAYAGAVQLRTAESGGRRRAAVLIGSACATVLLCALYFVGYQQPVYFATHARTLRGTARTLVEVLSVAFGSGGAWLWPYAAILVVLIFAVALCALLVPAAREWPRASRAAGLLACVGAACLVAAGIAWGRTVIGPLAGIPARYALLLTPGLFAAYFAAQIYARASLAALAQFALFACALAVLWPNTEVGIEYGRMRADAADVVIRGVAAGAPSTVLAERTMGKIYPNTDALAERLDMLRAQRSGPFIDAATQYGPCVSTDAALTVIALNETEVRDGVVHCLGDDGHIDYALARPLDVCGVRVVYSFDASAAPEADMQLYWMLDGANQFAEGDRTVSHRVPATPGEHEATFWIYDRIDRLRIDPDIRPFDIRIVRVEFLVHQ